MTNLTRAPHGSNLVMPCLAHRMYPDHLPCLLDPLTHQLGAVSSPQVRSIVTMQVTVNVDCQQDNLVTSVTRLTVSIFRYDKHGSIAPTQLHNRIKNL